MRVLVVEDERKLAEVLASALTAEHYDVVVAPTGKKGSFMRTQLGKIARGVVGSLSVSAEERNQTLAFEITSG